MSVKDVKKAEKQAVSKDVQKEVQAQAETQAIETHASYKVRTDLEFKKRTYNVAGKNVKLVAGEKISNEDYNLFNSDLKRRFFEKV